MIYGPSESKRFRRYGPWAQEDFVVVDMPNRVSGGVQRGFAPSARGLGVSPRFGFFPLPLSKGEGDRGGEGGEL